MNESILREDLKKSFEGRLPRLEEVLLWGGQPGVEYCYVDGSNIGAFQDLGFEMLRDTSVFTVIGPKGMCHSVLIMGRGTPIPGADPQNGVRMLGVDNVIRESTGLDMGVDEDEKPTPIRKQARKEGEATPPPTPDAA
jgi:hypothetical protein